MKDRLLNLYEMAYEINEANIFSLLEQAPQSKFLDLGCGDGKLTIKCAKIIGTKSMWGVEIAEEYAKDAKKRGIMVLHSDLNNTLPVKDEAFDVILSNQVIEHLVKVDMFAKEIHRVLKTSGYAVISTENLSSWHNIFALILGYRPFSQDCSSEIKIGNPWSPHHTKLIDEGTLIHTRVFTYQALCDFFEYHGFNIDKIVGAGYYLIPTKTLMGTFSKIDPRHSHFITIRLSKRRK